MSWRTVVITGSAKLDYKMDYLVIRKMDEVKRVHISEIGLLMIESTAVSLTTALISELSKKKVKIIFCDSQHNPQSELFSLYGSHDTSSKVRKQILWTSNIKKSVWTEIVAEKIRKQAELLHMYSFFDQEELLRQYIREMKFGDETNREGHAAKVYFNALYGMEFTRSEENAINAALNYGYSILLSYVNREIVGCGYITQLGLFHDNMFNPFNLGSDLMEPFRPLIDRKVYEMMPDQFQKEEKMEILSLFNDEVIINDQKNYVTKAIKIYCTSVFDSLNDNDISLIRFYRNEL